MGGHSTQAYNIRMALLRDLSQGLVDLVYPPLCLVCEQPSREQICDGCREVLTTDPYPTCPRCGSTIGPHADTSHGCLRCGGESFAFAGVTRMGPYHGVLRDVILRMKHDEMLTRAVGAIFAEHVTRGMARVHPIVVIPVPLHWKRRWQRGYNQAEVVAKALADHLRVPCRPRLLRRLRMTPSQAGLSATARRENLRGAIMVRRLLKDYVQGRTALLVDDVFTTGSTANAAAVALRAAGASEVCVAVIAHG